MKPVTQVALIRDFKDTFVKASYPFSASNLSQIRFVLPQNVHDLEASIRRFNRRIVAHISKTIRVFTNRSYTNEKL